MCYRHSIKRMVLMCYRLMHIACMYLRYSFHRRAAGGEYDPNRLQSCEWVIAQMRDDGRQGGEYDPNRLQSCEWVIDRRRDDGRRGGKYDPNRPQSCKWVIDRRRNVGRRGGKHILENGHHQRPTVLTVYICR